MGNILATCQQDPMQNVGQVVKALPAESKQEEKKSEPTNHAPLTVEEVIVRNEASLPPAPPTKEEEAYITPVQETAPSSDVTTTPAVVPSESESSDDLKAKAVVRARNEAEQLKSEEEKLVEAALEKKKEEESIALEVAEKVKVAEELIDKAVKLRKAKEAKANDDKVAEAVTLAAYNEDIVKEQHRRREIASEEAQKKVENALAKKEEAEKEGCEEDVLEQARREIESAEEALRIVEDEEIDAEKECRKLSTITAAAIETSINVTKESEDATEVIKEKLSECNDAFSVRRVMSMFDNDRNGELSREEIKNVLTVLTEKIVSNGDVDAMFDKYDTDGNGSISISELKPMLFDIEHQAKKKKSRFFRPKTKIVGDETKEAIFQAKEALMVLEIVHGVEEEMVKARDEVEAIEAKLKETKQEASEMSDKATKTAELANRQEKVVESIINDEWSTERVFAAFDADKNGVLDIAELSLALTSLLGRKIGHIESKKFAEKFDVNGDGQLDFEEFKAVSAVAQKMTKQNFFDSMFFNRDKEDKAAADNARMNLEKLEAVELVVEEVKKGAVEVGREEAVVKEMEEEKKDQLRN